MEIAPGIHRLEYAIDTKPMAGYVIEGDFITIVDTGVPSTPEEIYLPAVEAAGRRPEDVRLVVITHADADHIGGSDRTKALFPNGLFLCHKNDERWASDPDVITAERYDGFAAYGLRYEQAVFDMLASWMGPPVPMDILVRGGEEIRRTFDERLSVLHVPGHTPGHICLYNPTQRYALIGDAVFGRSQLDTAGGWSAPPPYTSVTSYRNTIQTLESLQLELLLSCHYPVMRGDAIRLFLDESRQFVDNATELARSLLRDTAGSLSLDTAVAAANTQLGPFAFPDDAQFAMVAHLDELVERGEARRVQQDGHIGWTSCGEK